ncbi:Longevity-assurance protein [Mycena indigotica]|uniref:Longevity-assurance protein n=1 Tax=Mycena indigotica TaxID=2126181 RepID=A0A8H6SM24_9AGAR|nr:Longevity-assurance protein [Mycena indigotica]KAF7301312.1 Longevity-assurance protein [Mycena indigotica]
MLTLIGEGPPPYLAPFFTLSYRIDPPASPDSFHDWPYYTTGPHDIWFIITCIAFMAIIRDVLRLYVFEPFAEWRLMKNLNEKRLAAGKSVKTNGHNNSPSKKDLQHIHRSVLRFAEQGWSAVYYPIQFIFGLYVNYNLPNQLLTYAPLWAGYPHTAIAAPLKFYYLTQTAFYTHQILILNAEAPRKDHYQMMAHHIITVFLMGASYYFNFTRVGSFIMVLMDTCDVFLPIAKMARYMEARQIICDSLFGIFVVSWFFTRHVLFMLVIWSLWSEAPHLITLQWDPANGHFLSREYHWVFLICLTALQIIQLLWFQTICRITWRVLSTGEVASDDRSDEEN